MLRLENSLWHLRDQIAKPRARQLQRVPGHVTEWKMATEHDAQHRLKQDKALGDLARCTGSSVPLGDVIAKRAWRETDDGRLCAVSAITPHRVPAAQLFRVPHWPCPRAP
jgi:hypothetical protein